MLTSSCTYVCIWKHECMMTDKHTFCSKKTISMLSDHLIAIREKEGHFVIKSWGA